MKKIVRMLLMLTCVFALTACGSEETLSEYQSNKIAVAEAYSENVVECVMSLINEGTADKWLNEYEYSNVELKNRFDSIMSDGMTSKYNSSTIIAFDSEGKAVRSAFTSFESGLEKLGSAQSIQIGESQSKVDGDTIVVTIPVSGDAGSGNVELIFSNDIFYTMTSCTLNLDESVGELMTRAALNTLIGMGTVFVVLILMVFIISAFTLIPKIQAVFSKKEETVSAAPASQAPVVEEEEELADDTELVAVIAAAIAAYEGTSADGFRVRSIKRAASNKWKRA